jgi:hypothetical protein
MRMFSISNTVLLIICPMYLILYIDGINISTAAPLIKADLNLNQYGARVRVFGIRLSLCAVPT